MGTPSLFALPRAHLGQIALKEKIEECVDHRDRRRRPTDSQLCRGRHPNRASSPARSSKSANWCAHAAENNASDDQMMRMFRLAAPGCIAHDIAARWEGIESIADFAMRGCAAAGTTGRGGALSTLARHPRALACEYCANDGWDSRAIRRAACISTKELSTVADAAALRAELADNQSWKMTARSGSNSRTIRTDPRG
jgi:hypothetical protein